MKKIIGFAFLTLVLSAGFAEAEESFEITNGVLHTDILKAKTHSSAAKFCAAQGAHLCRIADWSVIYDAHQTLALSELVWVDGILPVDCEGVSLTTGLRMMGWKVGNSYMQYGPVACDKRGSTLLRFRCCKDD